MSKTVYAAEPSAELSTRHCLDPWFNNLLNAERGIQPCCWHPAVDTLPVGGSLNKVLNGPGMRAIRRQLLTGQLNEHCRQCPVRPLTTPDILIHYLLQKMRAKAEEPST